MIKDRGNIKWSSLMLTEHRKKLEELLERDKDIKKPIIDEQQMEKMNNILNEAIQENKSINIIFYRDRSLKQVRGTIDNYESMSQEIRVINSTGHMVLQLSQLIDISF